MQLKYQTCFYIIYKDKIFIYYLQNQTFKNKKEFNVGLNSFLVPKIGLEPIRPLGSRDFKSLASAYSATPARLLKNKRLNRLIQPFVEAPPRFELGRKGFADLCLTAWLWCQMERETRFELATFALARQRSTTEPLPRATLSMITKNHK